MLLQYNGCPRGAVQSGPSLFSVYNFLCLDILKYDTCIMSQGVFFYYYFLICNNLASYVCYSNFAFLIYN